MGAARRNSLEALKVGAKSECKRGTQAMREASISEIF